MRTRAFLSEFAVRSAMGATTVACGLFACTNYDPASSTLDGGAGTEDAQTQGRDGATTTDGSAADSGTSGDSATSGQCDPDGPFGPAVPFAALQPMQQGPLSGMSLTADELRVYYGQNGGLFTASRASVSSNFGTFEAMPLPVGVIQARHPVVAGDGATLVFAAKNVAEDLIVTTLPAPATMGKLLTLNNDSGNSLRSPAPLPKAAVATFFGIMGAADAFAVGELVSIVSGHVAPVMSPTLIASAPVVSGDGTRLYVAYTTTVNGAKTRVVGIMKNQGGGSAPSWSSPTMLAPLGTPQSAFPAWISTDHCRLYVLSGDTEGGTPYVLQRTAK